MGILKTKLALFFFVLLTFFSPLAAVIAFEKTKRAHDLLTAETEIAVAREKAKLARYQYYLDVGEHKNDLKQTMADAKADYKQRLLEQPNLIKNQQTTAKHTVLKLVVTKQVTTQQVPVAKPKSSTKTKTS